MTTLKTLNPKELLRRYGPDVAVYAVLTSTLCQSEMQPQTADRYLRELVARTVIINEARRLPMGSRVRNIDRLTHSGRVMQFPNEGAPPTAAGAIAFAQRQLIAGRMYAAEDWSLETIEDNIEGESLEDTIIDVMGRRHGPDARPGHGGAVPLRQRRLHHQARLPQGRRGRRRLL